MSPFLGQELMLLAIGQQPTQFQITSPWDWFTVHTISRLPQYALVAWTKHQLLKGSE